MSQVKLFRLKNILTVGSIGLIVALFAFSISLWQTPRYKSTVKLLTVFNQGNIDTYTASKTANYITGILGEVVYSDSFIDSVYKSEPGLTNNLGDGSDQRQKNWKKIVKIQILDNKGIMIIDAFGENKYQANLLASTVGYALINSHGVYDGSQDRVIIKMIDTPSVYENWSTSKIMGDTGLGLLAGLLLGFTFIVIFPEHGLFDLKKRRQEEKYEEIPPADPIAAPIDYTQGKISNPWLDQYYQENLPEQYNRDNQ